MAGAVDFQTAFNNAVNSGGGFSTNNGVTTLTDKSGNNIGSYNASTGALINSSAPSGNGSKAPSLQNSFNSAIGGGSSVPQQGTSQYQNYYGNGMPYLPNGYDPNSAPAQAYQAWAKSQHAMAGNSAPVQAPQLTPLPASQTPAVNSSAAPDSSGIQGSSNNNNNTYLNPYWTQVQQQGHTSRELGTGENLTQVRNNEAGLYKIQPNQVNVVNSGGKTYLQVPWQLAQNHAYTQSANEQAQQQQQAPSMSDYIQALIGAQGSQQYTPPNAMNILTQQFGYDPNALNQQAQQEYQTQANSINQIIQQDQQMQKAEDSLLQTQLNDAVGQQNNTSFQDWLKAREGIAQRGLGNSGFLNDAMVRNQLNNEDKMQGIYNTAMDNQQKADATYQGDIAKQQQDLANLSPASMFDTLNQNFLKAYTPLANSELTAYNDAAKLNQANSTSQIDNLMKWYEYNNPSAYQNQDLALRTGIALGDINGTPTESASQSAFNDLLNQEKFNAQYGGKMPGGAATMQAQQNAFNDSLNSSKFDLQKWMDQQTVADNQAKLAVSQGQLALAQQSDAQKYQIAQENVDDTKTKSLLTGYTDQMTKETSGMAQYLSAGGKTSDTAYQKMFLLWQQAQDKFNNTLSGYSNSLGK